MAENTSRKILNQFLEQLNRHFAKWKEAKKRFSGNRRRAHPRGENNKEMLMRLRQLMQIQMLMATMTKTPTILTKSIILEAETLRRQNQNRLMMINGINRKRRKTNQVVMTLLSVLRLTKSKQLSSKQLFGRENKIKSRGGRTGYQQSKNSRRKMTNFHTSCSSASRVSTCAQRRTQ